MYETFLLKSSLLLSSVQFNEVGWFYTDLYLQLMMCLLWQIRSSCVPDQEEFHEWHHPKYFCQQKEVDISKIRIQLGVTTLLGRVAENVTFSSVKPLILTPNLSRLIFVDYLFSDLKREQMNSITTQNSPVNGATCHVWALSKKLTSHDTSSRF